MMFTHHIKIFELQFPLPSADASTRKHRLPGESLQQPQNQLMSCVFSSSSSSSALSDLNEQEPQQRQCDETEEKTRIDPGDTRRGHDAFGSLIDDWYVSYML